MNLSLICEPEEFTNSIFQNVEDLIEGNEKLQKWIRFLRLDSEYREYKHVIDYLFAQCFPKYKHFVFGYYKGENDLVKDQVKNGEIKESIDEMEKVILDFLDKKLDFLEVKEIYANYAHDSINTIDSCICNYSAIAEKIALDHPMEAGVLCAKCVRLRVIKQLIKAPFSNTTSSEKIKERMNTICAAWEEI